METTITTIRHGKSVFNAEKRYAGWMDVPLNEQGVEAARTAALAIRDREFDLVVTSTLQRAYHTAELLMEGRSVQNGNIPLMRTDLCRERNYGRMEGLDSMEVEELDPPVHYLKLANDFHSLNPPGGESYTEVRERAGAFADLLFSQHGGSRILVVSSFAFMQQLHGLFRGNDWRESLRDDLPNLVCTTFVFAGRELKDEISCTSVPQDNNHW